MSTVPLLVAVLGLGLTLGAWTHYLRLIAQERVPRRPWAHGLALVVGALLGVTGVALGPVLSSGVSGLALAACLTSLGLGLFFAWLLHNSPVPAGELVVAVGDPLPRFQAWTHTGEAFDSASLAGDRILLKFFRGHW